ncbi:hypothetical protein CFOL_v3_07412 [Cephalotus follicularis]|uniref:Uncharacterized protein n=1 Tax=Cephalotus follicularis TaxID=3775 RepID=A0A1Q3B7S0_CEPFO|nr:hypothetical protein CFOL_v3_07412 [Cephalotus follicularis]
MSVNRRQPLLQSRSSSSFTSSSASSYGFAEVVGGTTAECAAICCCCPCGLMNLLILAIYKVPAGLCRRALKKNRRKRLLKKGLLPARRRQCQCGCDETELQIHAGDDVFIGAAGSGFIGEWNLLPQESEKAVLELEKEMWDRFYGTGFWRSPSQREAPSTIITSIA